MANLLLATARARCAPSPRSRFDDPSVQPEVLRLAPVTHGLLLAGLLLAPALGWAQAPSQPPAPSETPAAAPTLPEVQVKGEAQDSARGTVQQLSTDDLAAQGAGSMADVVRYLPLVSAPGVASGSGNLWDGSGTTGYNIRGMEGNRVAIEVDGIGLPPAETKPDNSQANAFTTSRDTLEVELYQLVDIESGATASGRSGTNGQAGRVRFVTKSPEDFLTANKDRFASYKLGYNGADRSWLHSFTGAARVGQVQALGMYVRRDGHEEKSKGSVPPNAKDWDSNAALAKFVWGAGTANRLGLAVEHFERGTDLSNRNRITAANPVVPRQQGDERRTRVSLEHRYAPASGHAAFDVLETRLYHQSAESRNDTTAFVPAAPPRAPRAYDRQVHTNSEHDTWGFTVDASKQLDRHRLHYGLSLSQTDSDRPFEDLRTYRDNGQVSALIQDRAASAENTVLTMYVRDEIALDLGGRRATLTPGLTVQHDRLKPTRLDRYAIGSSVSAAELRKRNDTAVLPSLNFSLELQPSFHAFAQYSRGVRQPTVSELTGSYENPVTGYAIMGNPDLKKETSDNLELGVRGSPTRGVALNASVFYSRYRNYIEYTNLGVDPDLPQFGMFVYRTDNIGKARIWGTELSSRFELGEWAPSVRGLSLSFAGGWSKGTATNRVTGEKAGLASVLPAKVVLGLAYDDPARRFGAALHTTWVRSKQAPRNNVLLESEAERFKVPSFTTLDLSTYWHINRHVTWRLGIHNLTDRKHWHYASVRDLAATAVSDIERQARPGRSVFTSLEVRF